MNAKETSEALDKAGAEPLTSTPAELAAMIKDGVVEVRQGRKGRGRQAGIESGPSAGPPA